MPYMSFDVLQRHHVVVSQLVEAENLHTFVPRETAEFSELAAVWEELANSTQHWHMDFREHEALKQIQKKAQMSDYPSRKLLKVLYYEGCCHI